MKLQDGHAGDVADVSGDPLAHCRHLLSSLSASIPSAQSFRGRWSAVSASLSSLSASLSLLPPSQPQPHPLAADLLHSLPRPLAAALALSRLCAAVPSHSLPKLRTQSDLAAVAASLAHLAADADLLLRSGALLEVRSTIGSRRAEIRSLVTRLQIGTPASRAGALGALATLIRDSDKNVVLAAAEGAVPALVRLLDSRETRAEAVAAVARIAAVESCRHALDAEGTVLLNHLARVIESGDGSGSSSSSPAAAEGACVALQALTLARDNAMAIGSRGGVSALVGICQAGTPPSRAAASGVLKNLAGVRELRHSFLEDDAIPVLIEIVSSGTVLAQENAVACLRNLTAAEEEGSDALELEHSILRCGGINCIKNYWEAGGGRNLEPAIGLLRNLASNMYIAEIIISAGFLLLVVAALVSKISSSKAEAARLIAELAPVGKARKEFGELGCVPWLVGMLEAKAGEQEAAVMALASLMPYAGNRRRFRKEQKGIWNVVLLLDPLHPGIEKKYPIAVLQSVSHSRKCRKQMVAAGAGGYLQRLVEMEVEGAKRLLESLVRGKLWGVLTRT